MGRSGGDGTLALNMQARQRHSVPPPMRQELAGWRRWRQQGGAVPLRRRLLSWRIAFFISEFLDV